LETRRNCPDIGRNLQNYNNLSQYIIVFDHQAGDVVLGCVKVLLTATPGSVTGTPVIEDANDLLSPLIGLCGVVQQIQ
jgi:hypothetical protein